NIILSKEVSYTTPSWVSSHRWSVMSGLLLSASEDHKINAVARIHAI
ncbi:15474_t:CDS:1, partial [Gigaspora margarita]